MMDGRRTSPASSSITRPCICPEMPRAFTSPASTPLLANTWRMVSTAARHQSAGSCSAQPFCGCVMGYSTVAEAMTCPP